MKIWNIFKAFWPVLFIVLVQFIAIVGSILMLYYGLVEISNNGLKTTIERVWYGPGNGEKK